MSTDQQPVFVTPSKLYDFLACPHRVTRDAIGDPAERDDITPFVRLLWERGSTYEREVMANLAGTTTVLDLSPFPPDERERRTMEALGQRVPLIYQGRLRAGDLLGSPDLLRLEGDRYVPIDIKSGRGEEGGDDDTEPTPKPHYAVQLALYVDILEQLGLSAGRHAYVWDIQGHEVRYDFSQLYGKRDPRTLWQDYQDALADARPILARQVNTQAAYSANCKLCHWRSHCLRELKEADDLTLMAKLGRSVRDTLAPEIATIADMAAINPDAFIKGTKTKFKGVGADRLRMFTERARLIKSPNPTPRLIKPVVFPASAFEIFFDIETDPMQDICYLHGFLERKGGDNATERFVSFFTDDVTREAEETAFRAAWAYISAHPDAVIYYYSKYERTIYRKLQQRFPSVCSADDIEGLFAPARAVDLYFDVVEPSMLWPTRDHSIKTLAKFLGFAWRDTDPSGSASIEWYQRYCRERDPAIKARILDYNEDDCRATRVLLEGIRDLD